MKRLLAIVLAIVIIPELALGQGKDALPFSQIDRNPASLSMAGASLTATDAMAWRAFSNASAIAFSKSHFDADASLQIWSPQGASSTNINAGIGYKIGKRFGISAGFAFQNASSYKVLDESGVVSGTFSPKDIMGSIGVGIGFGPKFSMGLNARYMNQSLSSDNKLNGFSVDISLLIKPSEALGITAGVGALGGGVTSATRKSFSQPMHAFLGAGYSISVGGNSAIDMNLAAQYYFSGNFGAALGAQYVWNDTVFVRAGYRLATANCVIPSYLGIGLGAKFFGIHIDLSYLTASEALGNTLAIGLGYSF